MIPSCRITALPLPIACRRTALGRAEMQHSIGPTSCCVPFDDRASLHRRRLDRRQIVEPVMGQGQDKAARMLRQVSRRPAKLGG